MNRIFFSILTIIAALATVVAGTGAFFGDREVASGNTFAAGVIDLKVDNESYYNGNKCTNVSTTEQPEWQWVGKAGYPVPGTPCATSWLADDLTNGYLFFNFRDIKPDDEGEDTISLHVGTNPAWACMDVTLTSNDDNSSTEPELEAGDPQDVQDVPGDSWDGELADHLQFVWWADDGDNVLEEGEQLLSDGVLSLMDLATSSGPFSVALADSEHNVWNDEPNSPLSPDETHYIGKAWCFGTLTASPLPNDSDLHPQERGATGWSCDGTTLGNEFQTDGVTLDVAFRALQARGLGDYTCENGEKRTAKLTVIKEVHNNHGGNNQKEDFLLYVDNLIVQTNVTSGVVNDLLVGTYSVQEQGVQGYELVEYQGDCAPNGMVTLVEGDNQTCTIINEDIRPNVTMYKAVKGGSALPTQFIMTVNGFTVPHGGSRLVNSNTSVPINETSIVAGYHFESIKCDGYATSTDPLPFNVLLDEGEAISCTITNTLNNP